MIPFRFLHSADLHLDTPFSGVSRSKAALANRLADASLAVLEQLVELARKHEVDFVLLAGDLYDGPEHGLRAQSKFLETLRQLNQAGIHVYYVHGNHDPIETSRSILRPSDLPPLSHAFLQHNEVQTLFHSKANKVVAAIHGISHRDQCETRNLARCFDRSDCQAPFHIGLLHANVGGQPGHENYAPCSMADLLQAGMDYWALGHIHQRTLLRRETPCILYPGNPQGRHFGEPGQKGVTLVEVNQQGGVQTTEIPLGGVVFEIHSVDISAANSLDQVLEICRASLGPPSPALRLIRLQLAGITFLEEVLIRAHDNGELSQLIQERIDCDQQNLLLDRVSLATRPPVDRSMLRGGFEEPLLERSKELLSEPSLLQSELVECLKPLRNRFRDQLPASSRGPELLQRAEARLLAMLQAWKEET